jgi:uncharacterized protein (DUF849 family)
MIEACLNGSRHPSEHPALPVTADALAREAAMAVAAGADAVHIHPKARDGRDSLDPPDVGRAVDIVRRAIPTTRISVTTGAWAVSDTAERVERVSRWKVLPDAATVNWHELGCETVASLLLKRGVEVDVGIVDDDAANRFVGCPLAVRCHRLLVEIPAHAPEDPVSMADRLVARVAPAERPVLVHGEEDNAWVLVRHALARGFWTRIGLEDVLALPDGRPVARNSDLVRAAVALAGRS